MKNTSHYIEELIKLGENQHQDFKFAVNDSKKIARSLVAFANTLGGRLLIGVKDNGKIAGVQTDEEFYMIDAAAEMFCRPRIDFETKSWTISGKKVLEIIIAESADKPHLALTDHNRWMAFVRVDDENILASAVQIKVWQKQKSRGGIKIKDNDPGRKLLNFLNHSDFISLSGFLKLAKISYQKAVHILSDYIVLEMIEPFYHENGFVYRLKPDINDK